MTFVDSYLSRLPVQRATSPVAIIIHQTGETDLDKIIKYYTTNTSRIAPHYMVEWHGSVRRFVPEERRANHCAMPSEEAKLYAKGYDVWSRWLWDHKSNRPMPASGEQPNYAAWKKQWHDRGRQSPLELVTRDNPNGLSIGIEVQRPLYLTDKFFSSEQYEVLSQLVSDTCRRHGIPVARDRVLTHSDVCPLRRTNNKGPNDPPLSFDYNLLWSGMRGTS